MLFGRTSFSSISSRRRSHVRQKGRVAVSCGRRRLINVFPKTGTWGLDLLESKGIPRSRTSSRTSVNRLSDFNTTVASTFHAQELDYPLLAGGCMAAARLAHSQSCRAPDDDLALAPAIVAALSLDSHPGGSARGTAARIPDIEALATR